MQGVEGSKKRLEESLGFGSMGCSVKGNRLERN